MYELQVERTFSAAHAIVVDGSREPTHGHNWRVIATVGGSNLDADGLLCDFHELERTLDQIVERFENRNLNDTPPFDRINPTAENVVRHVADALARSLPEGVKLVSVSVSEAPGCVAIYRPG